jgi:hypothetical protein
VTGIHCATIAAPAALAIRVVVTDAERDEVGCVLPCFAGGNEL